MSTSSNLIELLDSVLGVSPACHPTKIFRGHTEDWVNSLAYFPDGRRISSASDKAVTIWDVESGRQDGQPLLHDSNVQWMALSPNGRRIASGTGDRVVVWDVLAREVVHEIKCSFNNLAYSPDGCWITTASTGVGRKAQLWDDDAGGPGRESLIQLWDADTGRPGREPLVCAGEVFCVAFSPDGSRIAVGLRDGSFQVIDIATGESVVGPIKGHTHWVNSVVYSVDGRLLLTGSRDRSIRVWDSKTGIEVGKPMLGHTDHVACISICADGRRIASGGWDRTVRVWDLETRLQVGVPFDAGIWEISQSMAHTSVAFSPDARYVISGGPDLDHVYLWDTELLASKGSSSQPVASTRIPPAPITHLRQQRQARATSHNDASSINSVLDLPAVVPQQPATQPPQERKPSVDDNFWDTDSIRSPLRPAEPQQDPPLDQGRSPIQPANPGHPWLRNIRERWPRIRPRKFPAPADIPNGLSRPLPCEQPIVPVSPELPTDAQTRVTSTVQPSVPGRPWSCNIRERWERIRVHKSRVPPGLPDASAHIPLHERPSVPASPGLPTDAPAPSRTPSSRNQNEVSPPMAANVALGKAYDRMAAAPPRDRNARRRWRARERRRAARRDGSDSESEDNDAESFFEDTGCLDAFCFLECVRWWRHTHSQ